MINTNENTKFAEAEGANGPVSVSKLKEYGKKAYLPIVDVVYKYQDEFTPYLNALVKGLQGGVEKLNAENATEAEKYVSQFFREASDGLDQARQKLESKDVNAITNFLHEQTEKRPGIMFSTSYIAGLFFGRLGRHIARQKPLTNEPPAMDESIH
ncbi:MAG: hypothetical protein NDI69_03280 [Bacteriovoracaceae bacterium]|nr:hypothetical protein [Bacteriovoracaceae bacterium]